MRILVEMVDSLGVEGRSATDDAVNLIAFVEQKLGKVRAVLPGDSSNERFRQSDLRAVEMLTLVS